MTVVITQKYSHILFISAYGEVLFPTQKVQERQESNNVSFKHQFGIVKLFIQTKKSTANGSSNDDTQISKCSFN